MQRNPLAARRSSSRRLIAYPGDEVVFIYGARRGRSEELPLEALIAIVRSDAAALEAVKHRQSLKAQRDEQRAKVADDAEALAELEQRFAREDLRTTETVLSALTKTPEIEQQSLGVCEHWICACIERIGFAQEREGVPIAGPLPPGTSPSTVCVNLTPDAEQPTYLRSVRYVRDVADDNGDDQIWVGEFGRMERLQLGMQLARLFGPTGEVQPFRNAVRRRGAAHAP